MRLDLDDIETLARRVPVSFESICGIWFAGDSYYVPPFTVDWFASSVSVSYSSAYHMRADTRYGMIEVIAPSVHVLFRRLADMAIVADAAVRDVYSGETPDRDLFAFVGAIVRCIARGERPDRVVYSGDGDRLWYRVGDGSIDSGAPVVHYAESLFLFSLARALISIQRGWDDRADPRFV